MNLHRFKRLWELSKKDPESLNKLTKEEIALILEVGNGKAVFFDAGYEEEKLELDNEDKFGIKKLFRIKNE